MIKQTALSGPSPYPKSREPTPTVPTVGRKVESSACSGVQSAKRDEKRFSVTKTGGLFSAGTRAILTAISWVAAQVSTPFRWVLAALLRASGCATKTHIDSELRRHKAEAELQYRNYAEGERSETKLLRLSGSLRSRLESLERFQLYLQSRSGRMVISEAIQRRDLSERARDLSEKLESYIKSTTEDLVLGWRQNFDESLTQAASPAISADERRHLLDRLDLALDNARFVVRGNIKLELREKVQRLRHHAAPGLGQ